MVITDNVGVCAFVWRFCSQLVPCRPSGDCSDPDHICVHHRRCSNDSVCYPLSMSKENICPPISTVITNETTTTTIPTDTTTMKLETTTKRIKFDKWRQNATTIAGGNGKGDQLNQLNNPFGIFIDQNKNILIVDEFNHRIMKWKLNESQGTIIAGNNERGNRTDQLHSPTNVIVDEQTNSLIIADWGNRRVIQWFNQNQQEILIENIICLDLTIDKHGFLYVLDSLMNEVRRWKMGEVKGKQGTLVAGGNRQGNKLDQLNSPSFIFVDDEQSVYISDSYNDRIMKWRKDAHEGVIVAGGNGRGNNLNQLSLPYGLIVDEYDQIYVVDYQNHRIMRWKEGAKEGEIIVGGNGNGEESNQLSYPSGLSIDFEGNLYVSDGRNNRLQKFDLIS